MSVGAHRSLVWWKNWKSRRRGGWFREEFTEGSDFFVGKGPYHLWDLSSPTRGWTWAPAVKTPNPNHWTANEIPDAINMFSSFFFDCSVLRYRNTLLLYINVYSTTLLNLLSSGSFLVASFSSVQFSHSVVSNSLPPHRLRHARPPCPSPTSGVYPDSCPLSRWCHPTISSVIPFSSRLQSFPASGSFPVSQFFASGGQSIGVSALASALPVNTQDWSPWGWTGWISLQSKGCSKVFSNTTVQKHQFFGAKHNDVLY